MRDQALDIIRKAREDTITTILKATTQPKDETVKTDTTTGKQPWRYNDPNVTYDELRNRHDQAQQQEIRNQEIQDHSARAIRGLRQFNKGTFLHTLDGGPTPTQPHVENFYRTIASSLLRNEIPIVLFQQLSPTSTALPANHSLDSDTLIAVSQTIYQKLYDSIPIECKTLRDILLTYNRTQDGYAAIYSIMRHSCGFLKTFRPLWGPAWPPDINAYSYKSTLDSWLDEQHRHGTTYTVYEQAAEFLQRACLIDRYKIHALNYLTKLQLQGPNQPVSTTYSLNELVNILESNAPAMPNTNPNTITINKFNGPTNKEQDNNTNNGTRRKFQYRREVQCECCHTFGHNVDEDICRIGAQILHTTNFIKEHPKKAENNANAFTAANNKNKINTIKLMPRPKPPPSTFFPIQPFAAFAVRHHGCSRPSPSAAAKNREV